MTPILGLGSPLIAFAIAHGVSSETLVYLLLLPVVATLVAFARHIIGVTGFSIFAPVGLTLVFLSLGDIPGVILFVLMLLIAALGKQLIGYLKMEYIPRTAMLLWFVALGLGALLILSSNFPFLAPARIEMFPLLLLVLLAEDFMAPIAAFKWSQIFDRSVQIMILAIIGAALMGSSVIQQFALLNPEIVIVLIAIANFLIGRYLGLRLTEYLRFRPLTDSEE